MKPVLALRAGATFLALIGLSRALVGFVLLRDGGFAAVEFSVSRVERMKKETPPC